MSIEAMKQALAKIRAAQQCHPNAVMTLLCEADDALRLAIEQAERQETSALHDLCQQQAAEIEQLKLRLEQEPVAWTLTETLTERKTTTRGYLWFSDPQNCMWTPLYATPPQRQPLTEIALLGAYEAEQQGRWGDHVRGLRAIEAAHGIGG